MFEGGSEILHLFFHQNDIAPLSRHFLICFFANFLFCFQERGRTVGRRNGCQYKEKAQNKATKTHPTKFITRTIAVSNCSCGAH